MHISTFWVLSNISPQNVYYITVQSWSFSHKDNFKVTLILGLNMFYVTFHSPLTNFGHIPCAALLKTRFVQFRCWKYSLREVTIHQSKSAARASTHAHIHLLVPLQSSKQILLTVYRTTVAQNMATCYTTVSFLWSTIKFGGLKMFLGVPWQLESREESVCNSRVTGIMNYNLCILSLLDRTSSS